jgi:hypothetical protein
LGNEKNDVGATATNVVSCVATTETVAKVVDSTAERFSYDMATKVVDSTAGRFSYDMATNVVGSDHAVITTKGVGRDHDGTNDDVAAQRLSGSIGSVVRTQRLSLIEPSAEVAEAEPIVAARLWMQVW